MPLAYGYLLPLNIISELMGERSGGFSVVSITPGNLWGTNQWLNISRLLTSARLSSPSPSRICTSAYKTIQKHSFLNGFKYSNCASAAQLSDASFELFCTRKKKNVQVLQAKLNTVSGLKRKCEHVWITGMHHQLNNINWEDADCAETTVHHSCFALW